MPSSAKGDFSIAFGDLISKRRTSMGLGAQRFAARMGVSESTIFNWENGKCSPRMELILDAASRMGTKGWMLFREIEELMEAKNAAKKTASASVRVKAPVKPRGGINISRHGEGGI